ncbi:unnamed protein product [Orchesella dallaii]|uniref:Uncharacterized protein n=1 Tax=Orchesella dallaii TaxID=48710 RepID=A0ABP1PYG5_9HEXA
MPNPLPDRGAAKVEEKKALKKACANLAMAPRVIPQAADPAEAGEAAGGPQVNASLESLEGSKCCGCCPCNIV